LRSEKPARHAKAQLEDDYRLYFCAGGYLRWVQRKGRLAQRISA